MIARIQKRLLREFMIFAFEFLQADHIRPGFFQPAQKISNTAVDAIDIIGSDLHPTVQLILPGLRGGSSGGDPDDTHSRYLEAFVNGVVIGCLYLPNGNPYPGPKFDYKLKWIKRLTAHGKKLQGFGLPVALIGDYNIMPTDLDTYKPEKYTDNALFRPEARKLWRELLKTGWTDAIRHLYPDERIYTFWDYLRNAYGRNAGLRLDHFLLDPVLVQRLQSSGVDKDIRGWEHSSDHAPVWIELRD